ncbi:MAG: hypothetical protein QOJ91_2463 [Sphingomonadales bacterium]|nr:hypothetical protein [Sphingomonadales bacterium]
MGDDGLAAALGRVEIGVEDAGAVAELELSGGAFADVEGGLAELGLEHLGGPPEDGLETGRGVRDGALRRRALDRGRGAFGPGRASAQDEQGPEP